MFEVVGYERKNYTFDDGRAVAGYMLFLNETVDNDNLVGVRCFNVFVSDKKLTDNGYMPNIGDVIGIYYNRFRKVERIERL